MKKKLYLDNTTSSKYAGNKNKNKQKTKSTPTDELPLPALPKLIRTHLFISPTEISSQEFNKSQILPQHFITKPMKM